MEKKKSRFWVGILIYVLIFIAVVACALAVITIKLRNYQIKVNAEAEAEYARKVQAAKDKDEAERISRAPQIAFETFYEDTDVNYWMELWLSEHPDRLESEEVLLAYFTEKFGELTPLRASDYTLDSPAYVIKNGDETRARVEIEGSGKDRRVSSVEMFTEGELSGKVTVPEGCEVKLFGKTLSEEYITERVPMTIGGNMGPVIESTPCSVSYEVSGLLVEPEFDVSIPNGYEMRAPEGEMSYLVALGNYDSYKTSSVKFVKALLFYFMMGAMDTDKNLGNVTAYLAPGGPGWTSVRETYIGVVWNTTHLNIDTSDTVAGDVIVWSDNCFSIDVAYNAYATLNGQHVNYASATARVYFYDSGNGNGYVMYDFETL
ncbi:MAG: hypothetical protein MJ067_00210 [Oscillospiraceae bacterium]|nr:hypothetical protein [Oscillospiraceae bacterium]